MRRASRISRPSAGPAAWTPSPSLESAAAHSPKRQVADPPDPPVAVSDRSRPKRKGCEYLPTPSSPDRRIKQRKTPRSVAGGSLSNACARPLSPVPTSTPGCPAAQRPPGPCFQQKYFRGKGFGLQATRTISRGEEIIREAPFITFRINEDDIDRAFNALSDAARILFFSFAPAISNPAMSLVGNIAETNALSCWNEDDDEDEEGEGDEEDDGDEDGDEADNTGLLGGRVGGSSNSPIDLTVSDEGETDTRRERPKDDHTAGLFENICRINHSCRPNAGWAWDPTTSQMVLYAYDDIAVHGEITASYQTAYNILPRAERQAKLSKHFDFHCACPACARGDSASDARLAEFRRTREWYRAEAEREARSSTAEEAEREDDEAWAIDRGPALYRLDRAMQVLEDEEQFIFQGEVLERRFRLYVIWAERDRARRAAEAMVEHIRIHRGGAFAKTTAMDQWRLAPETHHLWDVGRKFYGHKSTSDDGDSDFKDD